MSTWIDHQLKDIIADAETLRSKLHDAEIEIAVLKAQLDEAKDLQGALVDILKQMAVYEFILKQNGIDPETGKRSEDYSNFGENGHD